MAPEWWPAWTGETIIIIASGPSAIDQPLYAAKDKAKFIAVNESWRISPSHDMLFACDMAWWKHRNGCPEFRGLRVTSDHKVKAHPEWNVCQTGLHKGDDRMVFDEIGTVAWGGNSGFQAFNIAVQIVPPKIILVGFDMTLKAGHHWHGKHEGALSNPSVNNIERWRRAVDAPAQQIADRGIRVINASPVSTLRNYEKMGLMEALAA